MVLMPLVFAVGATTKLPLLYLGIPVLAALSVAHGFLPPHPSATAIAQQLHAQIGKTLLYGIIVAIPTIILAGIVFGKTLRKYHTVPRSELLRVRLMEPDQLPGLGLSLTAALMPLILLTATAVFGFIPGMAASGLPDAAASGPPGAAAVKKIIGFIGDPNMAMLISILMGIWLLGLRRGRPMKELMKSLEDAFKGVAPVMLIIAGAGVFMQVMSEGGVNRYIAESLVHTSVSPLLLGWSIAALIRVCTGSSTVAGLTTVGILLPFLQQSAVTPELMVLAIGAGSMTFSHVNDGGFWLFKEYFNLSIRQTFATWTLMETMVSVVGLLMVLLLNQIVH
jgi:Gnt-I system high-affinity gluconate transporter